MKVFISWSGTTSHMAAIALRDWLPSVIQSLEPYVSSEDIDKGARWSTDIAGELSASNYGILCVTQSNIEAPWLNFEAGALSKAFDKAQVAPLLVGIKRSDIKSGPLLQFQSVICERDDVFKLLISMNAALEKSALEPTRLEKIFEVWWPRLKDQLEKIEKIPADSPTASTPSRQPQEDIVEEMLELLRQQNRILNSPEVLLPVGYIREAVGPIAKSAEESIRSRSRLDTDHPVYADIFMRFAEIRRAIRAPEANLADIREKIERLERPLDYLAHRLATFGSTRSERYVALMRDP